MGLGAVHGESRTTSSSFKDIAAIKARSARRDLLKDVTSNCAGLVFDAGTAYGNLPTPDNTLTNELNVAYEDFASAGRLVRRRQEPPLGQVTGSLEDDRERRRRARPGDSPARAPTACTDVTRLGGPDPARGAPCALAGRLRFDREHPRCPGRPLPRRGRPGRLRPAAPPRALEAADGALRARQPRRGATQPHDAELGDAGVRRPEARRRLGRALRGHPRPHRGRDGCFSVALVARDEQGGRAQVRQAAPSTTPTARTLAGFAVPGRGQRGADPGARDRLS